MRCRTDNHRRIAPTIGRSIRSRMWHTGAPKSRLPRSSPARVCQPQQPTINALVIREGSQRKRDRERAVVRDAASFASLAVSKTLTTDNPEFMIRMLIIGYVFAIRSERALCREVQVNRAYRWFCGLSIEDKVPDHSAFSRVRNERLD